MLRTFLVRTFLENTFLIRTFVVRTFLMAPCHLPETQCGGKKMDLVDEDLSELSRVVGAPDDRDPNTLVSGN